MGEIINAYDGIEMTNVYGVEVPGAEGKAGMAAITLKEGASLDMDAFSQFVDRELPAHARPVFIRLQQQVETTVTFKLVKGALRKEAYHLDQVKEPLFILKPKSQAYEPLDDASYQQVIAGQSGF